MLVDQRRRPAAPTEPTGLLTLPSKPQSRPSCVAMLPMSLRLLATATATSEAAFATAKFTSSPASARRLNHVQASTNGGCLQGHNPRATAFDFANAPEVCSADSSSYDRVALHRPSSPRNKPLISRPHVLRLSTTWAPTRVAERPTAPMTSGTHASVAAAAAASTATTPLLRLLRPSCVTARSVRTLTALAALARTSTSE